MLSFTEIIKKMHKEISMIKISTPPPDGYIRFINFYPDKQCNIITDFSPEPLATCAILLSVKIRTSAKTKKRQPSGCLFLYPL